MSKSYKTIEIHHALKIVLGINYRFHFLDAYISPERIEWHLAVQFRNDPHRIWHPRLLYFYPIQQKVAILNKLGDDPLWLSAEVIATLAETKVKSPSPPPPAPAVS